MDKKLQTAKHAFASKRFAEARMLISEIIQLNQYEHNHKLYFKLAEACDKLSRYGEAEQAESIAES